MQTDPWADFPAVAPAPTAAPPANPQAPQIGAPILTIPQEPEKPKTTYRTLTPEEIAQRGLPAGGVYQESSEGNLDTVVSPPEAGAEDQKADQKLANLNALVEQINRVQQLYNRNLKGRDPTEYLPTPAMREFDAAAAGLAEQGLSAFRVPGVGAQSDTELRQFVAANKPSSWEYDEANLERLRQLRLRVDETRKALGLPAAEWTGMTDEEAEQEGLERKTAQAPPSGTEPPASGGSGGGGFLSDLGVSTQNALAGAAQGVAGVYDFPMEIAEGVQRGINWGVTRGGESLLRAGGLEGAADWWRRGGDAVDTNLANQASVSDLIEQASPTPEGMGGARFAAQLFGGAAVPIGPKAVPRRPTLTVPPVRTPAREVIEEGQRAGVRVMTSDVRPPTTFTGKIARAVGERIPYAGTGGPRAAQQEERIQAVRDLARDFGADAATDFLGDVASDMAERRGQQLTTLTRRKDQIIDGIAERVEGADMVRTQQAIIREIRRLRGIDADAYAPVIDRLASFRENIMSGKTLRQIEGNRRLLGDMFQDANLASIKGEGQKALNAIYGPLREDMGAFIERAAGTEARTRWKTANDNLAALAGELDDRVFRNVLRSAETTPENVARLLFSKKPSEVRRLVGNLSEKGRARAQAAVIARAIEQAGGAENISPDRFANAIGKMGDSVGVVFEGDDLARVKGLERLLQSTKQAGVASAAPPTGVQSSPVIGGYAAGSVMGPWALPAGGLYGAAARIYESPKVRNLLVTLGRAEAGSAKERQLTQRILQVVTSQMQIRGAVANDALASAPLKAAAAEEENN